MARGFKIADAFVEIHADTSKVKAAMEKGIRDGIEKADVEAASKKLGDKIGHDAGTKAASVLGKDLSAHLTESVKAAGGELKKPAEKIGTDTGNSIGKKTTETFKKVVDKDKPSVLKKMSGMFSGAGGAIFSALKVEASKLTDLGPILSTALMTIIPIAVTAGLSIMPGLFAVAGAGAVGALAYAILKDSPKVKNAFARMRSDIATQSKGMAEPFEDVFAKIAQSASKSFKEMRPMMADTFKFAAPAVEALASAFGGMARNILPGFNNMLAKSGPVLEMLARKLPDLGLNISHFFDGMADSGQDGADSLEAMINLIGGAIMVAEDLIQIAAKVGSAWNSVVNFFRDSAGLVGFLTPIYEKLFGGASKKSKEMADATGVAKLKLGELGGGFSDASGAAEEFSAAVAKGVDELYKFSDAEGVLSGKNIDVINANFQAKSSVDALVESMKKNGTAFDGNNLKSAENAKKLAAVAEAAAKVRFAVHEQTGSQELANKAFFDSINAAKAAMVAHGMNKQAVDALFSSLIRLPTRTQPEVHEKGSKESQAKVKALRDEMARLQDRNVRAGVTVTGAQAVRDLQVAMARLHNRELFVTTTFRQFGVGRESTGNGTGGFAHGGLAQPRKFGGGGKYGLVRGKGTGTGDKIPALLSDQEWITRQKVTRRPGIKESLAFLNRTGAWPSNGPTSQKPAAGASTGSLSSSSGGGGEQVLYATIMIGGEVIEERVLVALSDNPREVAAATDEGRRKRGWASSSRRRN